MPSWFVPLICFVALVGFLWFAFRQGTKVTPDQNNNNTGPSQNDYPPGPF
jgi:cbb3-type cytochrome oxidase subunit 3